MELTERLRAERALDSIHRTTDLRSLEWPAAASRIRNARSRIGLDEADVARRLGSSVHSYCDLEAYDDEAFNVATVRELVTLGQIVSVEPKVLLLGDEANGITRTITFSDIAQRLARRMTDSGVTAEQLGDEIGFAVEPLLASPEALWDYDIEGLYSICKALNMDWVAALPDLATVRRD